MWGMRVKDNSKAFDPNTRKDALTWYVEDGGQSRNLGEKPWTGV